MKNKFQKWTEEDSKFALKQRLMGKKFSTIAKFVILKQKV